MKLVSSTDEYFLIIFIIQKYLDSSLLTYIFLTLIFFKLRILTHFDALITKMTMKIDANLIFMMKKLKKLIKIMIFYVYFEKY